MSVIHLKAKVGDVVEILWESDPVLLLAPVIERCTAPPIGRLHHSAQSCGCDAGLDPPWVCARHQEEARQTAIDRDQRKQAALLEAGEVTNETMYGSKANYR